MTGHAYAFSVAPMMDWTDRHCRFLHRLITRHARLYTEMITADAVLYGHPERLLVFNFAEHPVALQLGGAEPGKLARAAAIGASLGYDEINLNVGCPSSRVKAGRFGACLMAEPALVADCVRAMKDAVAVPVTVKCRIGIDDDDSEAGLCRFVEAQAEAGADALIVHARKAWLSGLSPKENREIPPLDHGRVWRLRDAMPGLTVVINGGIGNVDGAMEHLRHVDGVMLGRAAYETPWRLAEVDRRVFGATASMPDRRDVATRYAAYAAHRMEEGVPLPAMTRHLLGLCHGEPGARAFRRHLTEAARHPRAGPEVILEALDLVERAERKLPARAAA